MTDSNDDSHNGEIPTVSVIVPAYNCEEYISDCLISLRGQTLTDFEVIIINDGSSDQTATCIENTTKGDSRFFLINQSNQGVSVARNNGLSKTRGEYIYFLDSDDELEPHALDRAVGEAREKNADVVHFNSNVMVSGIGSSFSIPKSNYIRALPLAQGNLYRELYQTRQYKCPVWLYMTRSELIKKNQLSFIPGIIHEDEAFTLQLILLSRKGAFIPETLHRRRIQANSIMNRSKSLINVIGYWEVFLGTSFWLEKNRDRIDVEDRTIANAHIQTFFLHALRGSLRLGQPATLRQRAIKFLPTLIKRIPLRYVLALYSPKPLARSMAK